MISFQNYKKFNFEGLFAQSHYNSDCYLAYLNVSQTMIRLFLDIGGKNIMKPSMYDRVTKFVDER